jgi:hypothetical protein
VRSRAESEKTATFFQKLDNFEKEEKNEKRHVGMCGVFSVLPRICPLHLTRNRTDQTDVLSLFPCPAQERSARYGLGEGD